MNLKQFRRETLVKRDHRTLLVIVVSFLVSQIGKKEKEKGTSSSLY